ncbi:MAG TPA: ATP-binding cassette domain-containing protein [Patescibacteria group bacterium]|nr:ATP-binding cassette domain-containing protein [Patescibacteria group bacterium]
MADYAIEAEEVYKYFGAVKALDGVSLRAESGTVFGLLGPNGAGKTTLVRVLTTLLELDKGEAKVLGVDATKHPDKVRRLIGLAGQYAAVDEFLTGRENMHMVGRLYHLPRAEVRRRTDELLEQLNLSDAANRQVRTYSGGMRRRLDLGASLVGHPKVLFLDEPTTGLDPRTRLGLWDIIRDLVKEGTTILLTTQYLDEADALANKIAVIDRGKVIAEGTSNQLKAKLGGDVVEFSIADPKLHPKALAAVEGIGKKAPSFDEETQLVRVPVTDGSKDLLAIVRALDKARLEPTGLALHRPSLDDVFLTLTGQKASAVATTAKQKRRGRE